MSQHYRSSRAQRFGRTISFGSSSEESQDEEEESPLTARFKAKRKAGHTNRKTQSQGRRAPPTARPSHPPHYGSTALTGSSAQPSTYSLPSAARPHTDEVTPSRGSRALPSTLQSSLHLPPSPASPATHSTPGRSKKDCKAAPTGHWEQDRHTSSDSPLKTPARRHKDKQRAHALNIDGVSQPSNSQVPHTSPPSAERRRNAPTPSPAPYGTNTVIPSRRHAQLPLTPSSGCRKRQYEWEGGDISGDDGFQELALDMGHGEVGFHEPEELCIDELHGAIFGPGALNGFPPLLRASHVDDKLAGYQQALHGTPYTDHADMLSNDNPALDGALSESDKNDIRMLDMNDFFDLPDSTLNDAEVESPLFDGLDIFNFDDNDMPGLCTDDEAEAGDSDDGDILARLMRRAQGLQEGTSRQETDIGGGEGMFDIDELDLDLFDEDDQLIADIDLGGGTRADRREQALSFLETILLQLLTQLQSSVLQVNTFRGKRLKEATERKKKAKMLNDASDENDGNAEGEEVDWDKVGMEIRLMNRRTGNSQIISLPDDPSLPGTRSSGQRRIACIMRVAELLYAATLDGVVCTKRDIFYHDVALFGHQRVVDSLVDDLAATAGLRRQDFCVCATSKGLIASAYLHITLHGGEELPLSPSNASLIPPIERIAGISTSSDAGGQGDVDWVLVVEKDAVFQTLCSAGLMKRPDIGRGVLITGKGYPDLATLQLLALIANQYPAARIFSLVDADPHGLDILSVYRYGSKASRYSVDYADLHLGERVQWMGVRASEWMSLGVRHEDLLSLTDKDVEKAQAMLRNRPDMPDTWRRELAHMLHLNKKAEIQILSSIPASSSRNQGVEGEDMLGGGEEGAEGERPLEGMMGYVVGRLREAE